MRDLDVDRVRLEGDLGDERARGDLPRERSKAASACAAQSRLGSGASARQPRRRRKARGGGEEREGRGVGGIDGRDGALRPAAPPPEEHLAGDRVPQQLERQLALVERLRHVAERHAPAPVVASHGRRLGRRLGRHEGVQRVRDRGPRETPCSSQRTCRSELPSAPS